MKTEKLMRWRLLLGGGDADGTGVEPQEDQAAIDRILGELYDADPKKRGGLGASNPRVNRWLGDIRTYFPTPVVRLLQKDAYERLGLEQMLLEPELLAGLEVDIHLVATLLNLKDIIPEKTKETARFVVRNLVETLKKEWNAPMRQAVRGAVSRSARTHRPKWHEIDWPKTLMANLHRYQPEYNSIIPERLIGYGRKNRSLRDVILCIDQSGSMASSLVYAGVFGSVLASLPALNTRILAFDTEIADLTQDVHDPVEILFGVQLGGGTDIDKVLGYCIDQIQRPRETILVLISDLYEGGNEKEMLKKAGHLVASGVTVISLLTLSDEGEPFYDHDIAEKFTQLGISPFACTPDKFPELMAKALEGKI